MTLIFINKRFPRSKHDYEKKANDNTDKLKEIMSKLTIAAKELDESRGRRHFGSNAKASAFPEAIETKPKKVGGFLRPEPDKWSYGDRKKKVKTFKL